MRSLLIALTLTGSLLGACVDGDIRTGCKNWCTCHRGSQSESACRDACGDTLKRLKKRDRARERQVAECLAAKGKRACGELTLCAKGVLNPAK